MTWFWRAAVSPWRRNLPRGLKQCRLDFFPPLDLCWAGVCLNLLLTLFFCGSTMATIRSHSLKPASPAIFCLPEQMAFCLWPLPHLGGQAGSRRSERLGGVEGGGRGGGGLSWRSRGLRTGCVEQAVAAAAQDGRILATTSADQYAICHVQRATALGRRQRRKVEVRSDVLQLRD